MLKRKIIETVEEYDSNGVLIKRTITETQEDEGLQCPAPMYPTPPYPSYPFITWDHVPTCTDSTGCKPS